MGAAFDQWCSSEVFLMVRCSYSCPRFFWMYFPHLLDWFFFLCSDFPPFLHCTRAKASDWAQRQSHQSFWIRHPQADGAAGISDAVGKEGRTVRRRRPDFFDSKSVDSLTTWRASSPTPFLRCLDELGWIIYASLCSSQLAVMLYGNTLSLSCLVPRLLSSTSFILPTFIALFVLTK